MTTQAEQLDALALYLALYLTHGTDGGAFTLEPDEMARLRSLPDIGDDESRYRHARAYLLRHGWLRDTGAHIDGASLFILEETANEQDRAFRRGCD